VPVNNTIELLTKQKGIKSFCFIFGAFRFYMKKKKIEIGSYLKKFTFLFLK